MPRIDALDIMTHDPERYFGEESAPLETSQALDLMGQNPEQYFTDNGSPETTVPTPNPQQLPPEIMGAFGAPESADPTVRQGGRLIPTFTAGPQLPGHIADEFTARAQAGQGGGYLSIPGAQPAIPAPPPMDFEDPRGPIGFGEAISDIGTDQLPFIGSALRMPEQFALYQSARRVASGEYSAQDLAEVAGHLQRQYDEQARGYTLGGRVGQILKDAPGFMAEIATVSPVFRGGRASVEAAARGLVRQLEPGILRTAAKGAAKAAGTAAGVGKTLPAFAPSIAGRTAERMSPTVQRDEATGDPIQTEEGDNLAEALYKATGEQFIEQLSEMMGGLPGAAGKAVGRLAGKVAPKAAEAVAGKAAGLKRAIMERWLRVKPGSTADEFVKRVAKEGGYHGVIGEVFEERAGEALRAAGGIEEYRPPTAEQLAAEAIAFGAMSGARLAARSGPGLVSDARDAVMGRNRPKASGASQRFAPGDDGRVPSADAPGAVPGQQGAETLPGEDGEQEGPSDVPHGGEVSVPGRRTPMPAKTRPPSWKTAAKPKAGDEWAPRPDMSTPAVEGRAGKLRLADGTDRPVRYDVVEAADLIPTHDPLRAFRPNEAGDANERPYEDPTEGKASRDTVLRIADTLDPDLLLTDSPTPTDGPPIVTGDYRVLGGNARSMGVQVAYARTDGSGDGYRDALIERAQAFGLDPARVGAMKAPVLVRRIDGDTGKRGAMSRALNESLTTGKTGDTQAVSRGLLLEQSHTDTLAGLLGDDSVREALGDGKRANDILRVMSEAGAVSPSDMVGFRNSDGTLTEEGKQAVERALLGAAVGDVRALAQTTADIRRKLIRGLASMTRLRRAKVGGSGNGAGAIDFQGLLGAALDAVHDMVQGGGRSIAHAVEQQTLTAAEWKKDPRAVALAASLVKDGPVKFANKLRDVASIAEATGGGQEGLGFGGPSTPAEAFDEVFETAKARRLIERAGLGSVGQETETPEGAILAEPVDLFGRDFVEPLTGKQKELGLDLIPKSDPMARRPGESDTDYRIRLKFAEAEKRTGRLFGGDARNETGDARNEDTVFGDVEGSAREEQTDARNSEEPNEEEEEGGAEDEPDDDIAPEEDLVDEEGAVVKQGRESTRGEAEGTIGQDIAAIRAGMGKEYKRSKVTIAGPRSPAERQVQQALAKMGRTVVFVNITKDRGDVRGVIFGRNGDRIYIRSGLSDADLAAVVLHEMGHSLRRGNPALYKALVKALGRQRIAAGAAEYRKNLAQTFGEDHRITKRFDRDAMLREDEGVAEVLAGLSQTPGVSRALIRAPGLWERVKAWVAAQLDAIGIGKDASVRRAVVEALRGAEKAAQSKSTDLPNIGTKTGAEAAQFSVQPVAIKGDEISADARGPSVRDARTFLRTLEGKYFTNEQTGERWKFTTRSRNHMMAWARSGDERRLLAAIPELVRTAAKVSESAERSDDQPNLRLFRRFTAEATVAGRPYSVEVQVKTFDQTAQPIDGQTEFHLIFNQKAKKKAPPGRGVAPENRGLASPDGEARDDSTPGQFALRPARKYTPGFVGPESPTVAQSAGDRAAAVRRDVQTLARLRRQGRAAERMITWRGAIEEMAAAFNMRAPLKNRRGTGRGTLGYYQPANQAVRLNRPDNFRTFIHEVGHYINDLLFPAMKSHNRPALKVFPASWRKELVALGQALYGNKKPAGGYASEGWAELIRFMVINPAHAKKAAPIAYREVSRRLYREYPEVWYALRRARERWAALEASDRPVAAYLFQTRDRPVDDSGGLWYRFKVHTIDRYQRALDMKRDMARSGATFDDPLRDPHLLALRAAGLTSGQLRHLMDHGTWDLADPVDAQGRVRTVGPGLRSILAKVRDDLDAWQEYMIAKRAKEKRAQGFGGTLGLIKDIDIDSIVAAGDANPEWRAAADEFQTLNEWLIREFAVHHGLIDEDAAERIIDKNKDYIPFRSAAKRREGGPSGSARFGNQTDKIARFVGGSEELADPLGAFIENVAAIFTTAHRNNVARAVAGAAMEPGGARWVERTDVPLEKVWMKKWQFTKEAEEQIGKVIVPPNGNPPNPGTEIEPQHWETIVEALTGAAFFRDLTLPKNVKGDVIAVLNGGKRSYYHVRDKALADMLGGETEPFVLPALLRAPLNVLRAGATAKNPAFFVVNALRDIVQAMAMTGAQRQSLPAAVRGRIEAVRRALSSADARQLFLLSGADMSDSLGDFVDHKTHAIDVDAAIGDRTLWAKFRRVTRQPGEWKAWRPLIKDIGTLDFIGRLNERIERATRIMELERVRAGRTGVEALMQAGQAAADVTVDFTRGGQTSKVLTQIVPFFNAAVQGTDKLLRFIRENPLRAAANITLYALVPSIISLALNADNDDYWAKPFRMRDRYWYFPLGGEGADQRYLRLPKPPGLAAFSNLLERSVARVAGIDPQTGGRGDPKAFEDVLRSLGGSLMPGWGVGALMPILEVMANYDYFREKPIVNRQDEALPVEEQGADRASELARLASPGLQYVPIARLFNLSPADVDHLIRGYLAGMGDTLNRAILDPALAPFTDDRDRPRREPADFRQWPIIKTFLAGTTRSDHEALRRFWGDWDAAQAVRRQVGRLEVDPERQQRYIESHRSALEEYERFSPVYQEILKLRKARREALGDRALDGDELTDRLEEIDGMILEAARSPYVSAPTAARRSGEPRTPPNP